LGLGLGLRGRRCLGGELRECALGEGRFASWGAGVGGGEAGAGGERRSGGDLVGRDGDGRTGGSGGGGGGGGTPDVGGWQAGAVLLRHLGEGLQRGHGGGAVVGRRLIELRRGARGGIGGLAEHGRADGSLQGRRHLLLLLMGQHGRREHGHGGVGKAARVVVLLRIRVGQRASHGDLRREVFGEPAVEVGRAGLQMGRQTLVLHGQVVVLLLVHLLVDDVLLRDAQRPPGAFAVDVGRALGGLEARFQTAVASP